MNEIYVSKQFNDYELRAKNAKYVLWYEKSNYLHQLCRTAVIDVCSQMHV
jgi:hypothetical protein